MGAISPPTWPAMDAMAVLALLGHGAAEAAPVVGGDDEAAPSARRGRPRARNAMAMLDMIGQGSARRTKRQRNVASHMESFRGRWRATARTKRLRLQVYKFNRSGRAVTHDDLMEAPARVHGLGPGRLRGRGSWKKWQPEAIQRAAFAKGTLRQIAQSMADGHGDGASGQRGVRHLSNCKSVCALTILAGQARGLRRLRQNSLHAQPLKFWITNNMFDETKLWYMIPGKGYRRFSTLALHGQVTWVDEHGTHDEDVFRAPKALRRYSAAAQWWQFRHGEAVGG